MIARSARWAALTLGLAVRFALAANDLPLTIDVENSKGLKAEDSVMFEGKPIGRVDNVGFGDRDTVEIGVTIDATERGRIHESGAFVVNDPVAGQRPNVEYFVIDARSPLAEPNSRFQGVRSVAEVWLRRGRISADELSRAMSQGVEQFRRNLEELRRSPEWAKFKDQVARLSAQLTVTGTELTRLLSEQLPKLQKELDDLYAEYQKQLEKAQRERSPAPQP
jgi:ABC-type transporter Mla subunit MlaD